MVDQLRIPLEEAPLMGWLMAGGKAVHEALGVGGPIDYVSTMLTGMSLAVRYPELAQTILRVLPKDCIDGVNEQADRMVAPFVFEGEL